MNQQVRNAFAFLGWIFSRSPRQIERLRTQVMGRWIEVEAGSSARRVHMLGRKARRQRAKELTIEFRPVYGYLGIDDKLGKNKHVIDAMRAMGPDRRVSKHVDT